MKYLFLFLPFLGFGQTKDSLEIWEGYIGTFEDPVILGALNSTPLPSPETSSLVITKELCERYLEDCDHGAIHAKVHMDIYTCGRECLIDDHYTFKWLYVKPTFDDFINWLQILGDEH